MLILFWLLTGLIVYVYIAYPALIFMLGKIKHVKFVEDIKLSPPLTLIIAAHNEEQVIREKIENSLLLDYPKERLEIIVASDASRDKTNEIVKSYFKDGIKLYDQKEHKGKSAALNYVLKNMAQGEIIVFSDATAFIEKDALRKITSYFADKKIGAVAGRLIFGQNKDSLITQNFSLYWRYEEFLRETESNFGYLPFVSGAFYAIRKKLYTPVPKNLPDDSISPLGVYKQGYRVVYAKDAIACESGAKDTVGEFRIKVRGVVRELGAIVYFKELLNPLRYPMLSLVLMSHRLMRWSVPIFLVALFFANVGLFATPIYKTFLYIQVSFYLIAACGLFVKKDFKIISIPFYFSLVNTAALWGIIKFLMGKKQTTWKSVR